jgi:hypothetical protein
MRASLSLPARPVNQNRNLNPNPISAFQVSALKFQLSGFSFQVSAFSFCFVSFGRQTALKGVS